MDIAQDGNLFPREDILEAVAQSDWRDQPVHAGAWVLGSLGLAAMALGLPILEPLAMEPTLFAAEAKTLIRQPGHLVARALGTLGLGIETAWYWISAVSLAAAFPLLGAALRALGIGARLALVVAFLSIISPLVWTHGRLPSNYGLGVASAALSLIFVCAPSDPGAPGMRGYGVRLALAVLFGTMLHQSNLLLAAPLTLAAWQRGRWRSTIPVMIAALLALNVRSWSMGSSSFAIYGIGLDALFCFGALGLTLPLVMGSSTEESPPPVWLWLWFGAGLVGARPLAAVALAALAAGALARFARPDNALKVAAGLLAVQLLGIFAASALLPATEVSGLAGAGPDLFQKADIVVVPAGTTPGSRDPMGRAAYLVRRRFGVPVMTSGEEILSGRVGRRVALGAGAQGATLDPKAGKISARGDGPVKEPVQ